MTLFTKNTRFVFVLLLLFYGSFCQAQDEFSSINMEQIKQKKVRRFLRDLPSEKIKHFADLEPSVVSGDDLSSYKKYTKEYKIKDDFDEVWFNYNYSNQTEIWDLSRISFGMIYCRNTETMVYADEFLYGMEVGRIYCLNLKILNGLYNLPVAFEIITIDKEAKVMEFSYLKGGKAQGKQRIQFIETDEGYTKIVHQSYVKSKSKFRDKYLYPFFHNKLISEFHLNMKRTIAARSKSRDDLIAELK